MAKNPDVIEIRFPNRSEYVGVVRLAVSGLAARCNCTIDEIEDLKIAVTEACTNAVLHGYNGKSGQGLVRCLPGANELTVEVIDQGVGFNVKKALANAGQGSKNTTPGLGLGLTFIQTLMNEMKVSSTLKNGTTVRFKKIHA